MDKPFRKKNRKAGLTVLAVLIVAILCSCAPPYPSPIPCGDTAALIDAMVYANSDPTTLDVIELDAGCVYILGSTYDTILGNTGLPLITSPIRIIGNGATIARKNDPSVEKFRLFMVSNGGDLELRDMILENGYAYDPIHPNDVARNSGGAIRNTQTLVVANVIIQNNSADGVTGGIYNEGDAIVKASTLRWNDEDFNSFAMGGATALHNRMGSTMTVVASTINGNGLNGMFNAISNDETATLSIENSTISGNSGTAINNDGNLDLTYVTIVGNSLGIWSVWYGIPKIHMTGTLFQNANDCSIGPGVMVSNLYNMDSDGSCGVMFTIPPAALHLGPLTNNGGDTETHALLPGSPAIEAVTGPLSRVCPIPEDQRGISRPQFTYCDIGAYEFNGSSLPQIAPTFTFTPSPTFTDTPTPTATFTPTPEPAASRCGLFDGDNATLTMMDIPYGTTNLTVVVKWPHPVWGLEEPVPGDDDPWEYTATLGSTGALKCYYQDYPGRLFCDFELPQAAMGASLPLYVYVNNCDTYIFAHLGVSIFEPPPECSADISESACSELGGTFDGRRHQCNCP